MINSFDNEYAFLSNFYPSPIIMCAANGEYVTALTVEHYFQAMKTKDITQQLQILRATTPGQAKRLGRKCTLREDWEEIKDQVMLNALRQKFMDKQFKEKLLATGNQILVEGNTWGDTYWGVCRGQGKNKLGKLLMQVREEIKNE